MILPCNKPAHVPLKPKIQVEKKKKKNSSLNLPFKTLSIVPKNSDQCHE